MEYGPQAGLWDSEDWVQKSKHSGFSIWTSCLSCSWAVRNSTVGTILRCANPSSGTIYAGGQRTQWLIGGLTRYQALPMDTSHITLKMWKWKLLGRVWLFATPWTIQSMEFSRPEHWSGWSFPSSGDLSNPGIKPGSPALQADSLPTELSGKPTLKICKT